MGTAVGVLEVRGDFLKHLRSDFEGFAAGEGPTRVGCDPKDCRFDPLSKGFV